MVYKLGVRSILRLRGVHPDLIRVVKTAIGRSSMDFTVLEGLRTQKRQAELFSAGASQTLNSRHLTGHAVDLAPFIDGTVRWDWPLYDRLGITLLGAASALNIPLEWGGHWRMRDGPHFQLPWKDYPSGPAVIA